MKLTLFQVKLIAVFVSVVFANENNSDSFKGLSNGTCFQGYCYAINTTNMTNVDGETLCKANGGVLLYLLTNEEFDFVSTWLQSLDLNGGAVLTCASAMWSKGRMSHQHWLIAANPNPINQSWFKCNTKDFGVGMAFVTAVLDHSIGFKKLVYVANEDPHMIVCKMNVTTGTSAQTLATTVPDDVNSTGITYTNSLPTSTSSAVNITESASNNSSSITSGTTPNKFSNSISESTTLLPGTLENPSLISNATLSNVSTISSSSPKSTGYLTTNTSSVTTAIPITKLEPYPAVIIAYITPIKSTKPTSSAPTTMASAVTTLLSSTIEPTTLSSTVPRVTSAVSVLPDTSLDDQPSSDFPEIQTTTTKRKRFTSTSSYFHSSSASNYLSDEPKEMCEYNETYLMPARSAEVNITSDVQIGCKILDLITISTESENKSALVLAKRLSMATDNLTRPKDLELANNLLSRLNDAGKREINNLKTSEEIEVWFQNYSNDFFQFSNNLLDDKNEKGWKKFNETQRIQEVNKLTSSLELTGKLLADKNVDVKHSVSYKNIDTLIYSQRPEYFRKNRLLLNSSSKKKWGFEAWIPSFKQNDDNDQNRIVVVGIVYHNLHLLLEEKSTSVKVESLVLGLTIYSGENSIIDLHANNTVMFWLPKFGGGQKKVMCGFWNTSIGDGQWDTAGCQMINRNQTHVNCKCSHLTNFALLMDVSGKHTQSACEKYLTIMCGIISIVCEIFTVILFQYFRTLRNTRTIMTQNLCITLAIGTALMLVGLDKTRDRITCAAFAILMHYTFLSAFAWMGLEGYHLYMLVVFVFKTKNSHIWLYYFVGYGIPAAIVAVAAAVHPSGYGNQNYCWLTSDDHFVWVFLGPVAVIIVLNSCFLTMALRSAAKAQVAQNVVNRNKQNRNKKWIKGGFSLMTLLGITWVLGYFSFLDQSQFIKYAFIILNSLQGLFIFVFHCVLNENVQQTVFRTLCHTNKLMWWKLGQKSFFSGTSQKSSSNSRASVINRPSTEVEPEFSGTSLSDSMLY